MKRLFGLLRITLGPSTRLTSGARLSPPATEARILGIVGQRVHRNMHERFDETERHLSKSLPSRPRGNSPFGPESRPTATFSVALLNTIGFQCPDGFPGRPCHVGIVTLREWPEVRHNLWIADTPQHRKYNRHMLSASQRLSQKGLRPPPGFRQQNSSSRPHILVLRIERLDKNAACGVDSGQAPKRARATRSRVAAETFIALSRYAPDH